MWFVSERITKWQLAKILFSENGSISATRNGIYAIGILQSITREDGSGSSFILNVLTSENQRIDCYMKTID